jgi:hypothetical protein
MSDEAAKQSSDGVERSSSAEPIRVSPPRVDVDTFIRRITRIVDPALHVAPVRDFLAGGTPGEVVEGIRQLMSRLEQSGCRAAYRGLVHIILSSKPPVPVARVQELYRAAYGAGYDPVRFLLLKTPPKLVAGREEVLPDPELWNVPLGRRRWLARMQNKEQLLRLARDPDPRVVENVLRNPRVVEIDVVRIAARRPNLGPVLRVVAEHPRWSHCYEVQRAVIQNPYAEACLAAALTPFLTGPHLEEVARMSTLHDAVRQSAVTVLRWRKSRAGAPANSAPDSVEKH